MRARFNLLMSSSVLPENIEPQITSILPRRSPDMLGSMNMLTEIGIIIVNFMVQTLNPQKYPLTMERLAQLIGKLNEQFEQNADPSQLLVTAQLIESELMQLSASSRKVPGTSKVAVVMPSSRSSFPVAVQPAPVKAVQEDSCHRHQFNPSLKKNQCRKRAIPEVVEMPVMNGHSNGYHYDPLKEIPTLAHQASGKEINDSIAFATQSSLNDKLKEDVVEVGHRLTDSPVRDLKRAIGVNDRFVFISELFRGDEVMYERSIKTINGFRILPEAEYWIERELKVKLGWDETKSVTRHFYQLVKRRFS